MGKKTWQPDYRRKKRSQEACELGIEPTPVPSALLGKLTIDNGWVHVFERARRQKRRSASNGVEVVPKIVLPSGVRLPQDG